MTGLPSVVLILFSDIVRFNKLTENKEVSYAKSDARQ
jgi:hypothetical protein